MLQLLSLAATLPMGRILPTIHGSSPACGHHFTDLHLTVRLMRTPCLCASMLIARPKKRRQADDCNAAEENVVTDASCFRHKANFVAEACREGLIDENAVKDRVF